MNTTIYEMRIQKTSEYRDAINLINQIKRAEAELQKLKASRLLQSEAGQFAQLNEMERENIEALMKRGFTQDEIRELLEKNRF